MTHNTTMALRSQKKKYLTTHGVCHSNNGPCPVVSGGAQCAYVPPFTGLCCMLTISGLCPTDELENYLLLFHLRNRVLEVIKDNHEP